MREGQDRIESRQIVFIIYAELFYQRKIYPTSYAFRSRTLLIRIDISQFLLAQGKTFTVNLCNQKLLN